MKNILILSDIHNSTDVLSLLKNVINESDFVIFAGDGYNAIASFIDDKDKFIAVKGNCDSCYGVKDELVFEIEDVKILLTHGDKYSVKANLTKLIMRAEEIKPDIVIFGHTHLAEINEINGITFINSGSLKVNYLGISTYAYMTICKKSHNEKIVNVLDF